MNQHKNIIMKTFAITMVLFIIVIPAIPNKQYKKVQASEGIVDTQFYMAVLTMIGITSALIGNMSSTFTIPETDLLALKDQFAQTLEADAVKKQAWLEAQTDYLAGGIAKTMGSVELAKIGLYDIYEQFNLYLNNIYTVKSNVTTNRPALLSDPDTRYKFSYKGYEVYEYDFGQRGILKNINPSKTFVKSGIYYISGDMTNIVSSAKVYLYDPVLNTLIYNGNSIFNVAVNYTGTYSLSNVIGTQIQIQINNSYTQLQKQIANDVINMYLRNANIVHQYDSSVSINDFIGYVNYNSENTIINQTDTALQVIPTIPWIDTNVPVGTIVTPAISAPYAGAVPIDVPITVPIDPPIEEPVDPPADATLLGTVAAILAGITPISAILDDIKTAVDTVNTSIIDTVNDIVEPLTGINDLVMEITTFPQIFADYY